MNSALKRVTAVRSRISTQLYFGIAGAVLMTFAATIVGWVSFVRVGEVQSRVNQGSVPALAAAFGVAQQSGALVAAATRLTAAQTVDDLAQVSRSIVEDRTAFEAEMAALAQRGGEDENARRIGEHGAAIIANIEAVLTLVLKRFSLNSLRAELRADLSELRGELIEVLVPAIDDQLFYAMTGYRELGAPPAPRAEHFSEAEFGRYRYLAELREDATIGTEILATILNTSDPSLLEPLRERFEGTARGLERRLAALGMAGLRDMLKPSFDRMTSLGLDSGRGLLDLRARELELAAHQRDLLARNRDLAVFLVAEAEGLVATAEAGARDAARASESAILTGRNLLLGLSIASVVGAVLIAWLLIGRVLLRRLQKLSERMRRMAEGDLEEEVEIIGNDEVAEMASALEVFRRHALEVQRLNLVEKLADELRDKNSQLENTLADLQRAQDQIVVQQKLAALGELTAGVAHEIRNPLNFVKNFSESSEELLEELLEEVREAADGAADGDGKDADAEERLSLIDEIGADVTENLKRIRQHGERANRIVESMLQMGRGSGEKQKTNLNLLLDEHARLAYHSARATDSDFRLDIRQDFDEEVGELEVIPQDLGRVFLNMVGNACHATDDRRRAAAEDDDKSYEPTLMLSTKAVDDRVVVRIRDNGGGIPPDVLEKMFNPFFTTKPAGQGTGLGLAISNDIVRQHGGEIKVDSKVGEFTEMTVELPR